MNGRTNTTSVTEVIEGVQVPLEAPTNLVLTPLNARVDITWTDPVDKFAAPDGQTATNPWDNVATWDHTIVVRKANSAPTSPSDGELIYTETTRNQHQYTAYSDTNNVINNTVYYYAVYAVTTMDAVSEPIVDSCKPIEGTPVFKQSISDTSGYCTSAKIGNYALFTKGGKVTTINTSLTKSQTSQSLYAKDQSCGTNTLSFAFFGGGDEDVNVYAFDSSLTRHTCPNMKQIDAAERIVEGAAGLREYGIFPGGTGNRYHGIWVCTDNVYCIDQSLTTIDNVTKLTYSNGKPFADALSDHVFICFIIGSYSISGGTRPSSNEPNPIDTYDLSLTKYHISSALSDQRQVIPHTTINGMVVYIGGDDGDIMEVDPVSSNAIDAYNDELTHLYGSNIPTGYRTIGKALALGSYIMITLKLLGDSNYTTYLLDNSLTTFASGMDLDTDIPIVTQALYNYGFRYRNGGFNVYEVV